MEFRLLGPLQVLERGRSVPLGGPKQRSVLALLLLHPDETVSTDLIAEALWDGSPPVSASKAIQMCMSRLRKELGSDRLVTRPPGYTLHVGSEELDVARFQTLLDASRGADPADAARLLREALALWRGRPLADLAYESFAQPHIARMDALRLTALEARIDADLATGRHAELIGELDALVLEHPLRERLRAQLMLALYRSGRQSDALAAYRAAHRRLLDELGLEPGTELQALEQAILRHDPALDLPRRTPATLPRDPDRCIVVFPATLGGLDPLLDLASAVVRGTSPTSLVITLAVPEQELEYATAALAARVERLRARGLAARSAAFASPTPGADVVRLAERHGTELLLTDGDDAPLQGDVAAVLELAGCDVAVHLRRSGAVRDGPVIVPFGAAEHDWAALELAVSAARGLHAALRLAGAGTDGRDDGRNASRLLADASLIVQRQAGIAAQPLLATPGRRGLRDISRGAGLLVVGLPDRWREEGLGVTRSELAAVPPAPTVLVRRGGRPGGLTPTETRTRFGWSLTAAPP
jgi:DNA-binding SARP family transcriptional activator